MESAIRRHDHDGQEGKHSYFAAILELNSAVKEVAVSREVGGGSNPYAGVDSVTLPRSTDEWPRIVALVALEGESGLKRSTALDSRQVSIEQAIGANNDPTTRVPWPGAKPREWRRLLRAPLPHTFAAGSGSLRFLIKGYALEAQHQNTNPRTRRRWRTGRPPGRIIEQRDVQDRVRLLV
jgi:hypothetical protein